MSGQFLVEPDPELDPDPELEPEPDPEDELEPEPVLPVFELERGADALAERLRRAGCVIAPR